jgi:PilX N-terminal
MKNQNFVANNSNRTSEKGAALITSIFGMLLVTVLGVALMGVGMTANTISQNDKQQTEAFYIAESGINHAVNIVKTAGSGQFTNILRAGDGNPGTGDELSTQPVGVTPIPLAGLAFGQGTYKISVSDDPADSDGLPNTDSNQKILIRSVASGKDGSTATIESIIGVTATGQAALLFNGNLLINGAPIFAGSAGAVHANGALSVTGHPCALSITSTAVISAASAGRTGGVSGSSCSGAGTANSSAPVVVVPTYDIRTQFYSQATWVMGAIGAQAGKVYNSAGTMIFDASSGGVWTSGASKWTYNTASKTWTHTGNSLTPGTYYSEGNITTTDNYGMFPGTAVPATMIAEGSISLAGNGCHSPSLGNYSLMAGKDLKINGDGATGISTTGLNYAGDQVSFNGNPTINGAVIGANQTDTAGPGGVNLVSLITIIPDITNGMVLSGNPRFTYSGGLYGSAGGGVTVVSWREVRN